MLQPVAPSSKYPLFVFALRLFVLACAALLIAVVSVDAFHSHSFESSADYRRLQFWICIVFIADLAVEWFLSQQRRRYAATHWLFLLMCIPYVNILEAAGAGIHQESCFVLQLLPVLRAAFVVAAILSDFNIGKAGSLFWSYIVLLLMILYFSSLIFYLSESGINPSVHSYRSAVYWAFMSLTTTGSNIPEATLMGQALAGVLSATGLILFPVFTIYISDAVKDN